MRRRTRLSTAGIGAYLEVLRLPGALRAFVPSVLGRLSFAMVSLSLLLWVQSGPGGFALAGAVTGGFGLGNVAVAPLRARLVDRWGPRWVLPALAVGYAAGLIAVVAAAASSSIPASLTVCLAVVAGLFPPPVGAVMRGVWASLSPTQEMRTRAYSLDAVVEELAFIVGPLIVGVLAVMSGGPLLAVLTAAGVGLLGTLAMVGARLPGPDRTAPRVTGWVGPLRHVRMWPILLALVGTGFVFSAIVVLSAAHGQQAGDSGLAGALVACSSLGSAVGGFAYGSRRWKSRKLPRLLILAAIACTILAVSAWAEHPAALFVAFAATGLFIAPTMITGYVASDEIASPSERTEASTLINTAVNLGSSLSLALGGVWLTVTSPSGATLLLAGAAAACILGGTMIAALTRASRA